MYLSFMGCIMLEGDTMFYVSFIVSCFTYDTLVIYLYYEVIHGMCLILCFLKSRIYIGLLVFPHMRLCVC